MAEKMRTENVGGVERVALELTLDIASKEEIFRDEENYRRNILDLYDECLIAVKGYRKS